MLHGIFIYMFDIAIYPLKRIFVTILVLFSMALNWTAMRDILARRSNVFEYGFVVSSSCILAGLIVRKNKI